MKFNSFFCWLTLAFMVIASVGHAQTTLVTLNSSGQAGAQQTWTNTYCQTVTVRITAKGGGGGGGNYYYEDFERDENGNWVLVAYYEYPSKGSTGATMVGEFVIPAGHTLRAVAGGKGGNALLYAEGGNDFGGGGGGAGSGVVNVTTNTLLLLAAGGTGANSGSDGIGGSAATDGNGNGGGTGTWATGGGGLNGAGLAGGTNGCPATGGGQVLFNGISPGAQRCSSYTGGRGGSGMGGGGGASDLSGGGGGHTGGNGGNTRSAAKSYNTGANPVNTNGEDDTTPNDGTVLIELISTLATLPPDVTPPTLVCKNKIVSLSATGTASIQPGDVFQSGTDNCGIVNLVSVSPDDFTCANIGLNTVTLTASDYSGNTGTCTATVTVVDNTRPTVNCKDATIYLSAAGTATVTTADVFQSGSDNCGTVHLSFSTPNTFNCSKLGTNNLALQAYDGHGNSAACLARVTVLENQPPTVTCKSTTVYLSAAGTATVSPADVFLSGTDNCGTVNPASVLPNAFTCANSGTNTVTLTANDGNGNTATCTATVTLLDEIPPSVNCKSFTAYLSAAGTATVMPADVYQSGTDNCGTVNLASVYPEDFTCSNLGITTVFLLAYDGSGNSSGCTAAVIVADNIAPTASCKSATVYLSAAGTATVPPADVFLNGTDNCGTVNPASVSPGILTCANVGANTVTLMVNDGNGNTATCNATVTVLDKIPPSVTCKNFTAYLSATGTVTVFAADVYQGGTDNCGAVNPSTVSPNSFICNNLGQNTVFLLAFDSNGNSSGCSAMVTVADNTPPTVTCKNATVVLSPLGTATVTTTDVFQSGADNCGTVSPASVLPNAFTCSNLGNNTVTLTVNDGHGNMGTCNATVAVRDERAPMVSCPANQNVVPTLASTCTATLTNIDATASDNCAFALSYTLVGATTASGNGQASGRSFNSGNTTVTYTATDGSGNTGTCLFSVTVAPCINGRIIWKQDQSSGVKDVTVAISGDQTLSTLTGADGLYGFVLPAGSNFTVTPSKNLNKLNGVNAQDVFRLQQHLSGNLITDPWQLIAADANSNGQINSLDLSIIQQSILGNPSVPAQMVKSWRFVPTSHLLNNPPWGFPENIVLTGISGKQVNQDFYGVKVGDLVASYASPANGGSGQDLALRTADQTLQVGQTLSVALEAAALTDLAALQFALRFDPERLRLTNIVPLHGLPLTPDNIGAHEAENGRLRVLWAGQTPVSLKNASPLLHLQFEVLESGGLLSAVLGLDDETLAGHVYNSRSAESGVSLRFDNTLTAAPETRANNGVQLLQNRPNPFRGQTTIAFALSQACEARLRIMDAGGRVLTERVKQYADGQHEETFDLDAAPGVLYYELTTPFGVQMRKMTKVE